VFFNFALGSFEDPWPAARSEKFWENTWRDEYPVPKVVGLDGFTDITVAGWWLSLPSEKYD
jgi:hypothetical protein